MGGRKKPKELHKKSGPKKVTEVQKANLIPFQKGISGNPNGRPKKLPELKQLLTDVLGQFDDEAEGITVLHTVLAKLTQVAKQGNVKAAEIIIDRVYGKAHQSIAIKSDSDEVKQITGFKIIKK